MKKLFLIPCLFVFALVLFSCGGNDEAPTEETANEEVTVEEFKDNPNAEITAADTSSTGVYQEEVTEEATTLQEALQQTNSSDTQEEESGMSFCDCVRKQKELEKLMLETEDDAEFDKAMEELQQMKDGDCKILFEGNQTTIEDKQAHERKVKACL